jgi:hypothetical protein
MGCGSSSFKNPERTDLNNAGKLNKVMPLSNRENSGSVDDSNQIKLQNMRFNTEGNSNNVDLSEYKNKGLKTFMTGTTGAIQTELSDRITKNLLTFKDSHHEQNMELSDSESNS